jgi:hypothetical protein
MSNFRGGVYLMSLKSLSPKSNLDRQRRTFFKKAAFLLGLIVIVTAAFSIQTSLLAAGSKNKKERNIISLQTEVTPQPVDMNRVRLRSIFDGKGWRGQSPISPLAIPSGTSANNVTFIGIDATSSVTATADTNGDRIPDATEDYVASPDPDNEATSAMAFSAKSGKGYVGYIIAGGRSVQTGMVLVVNNPGNFRGTVDNSFSVGKGTPVGMVVVDSPQGDVLIVATAFFTDEITTVDRADNLTITAYLPNASGVVDGVNKKVILAPGALQFGSGSSAVPVNFSLGGLAIDSNRTLFVNIVARVQQGTSFGLAGAIAALPDSDADGLPDTARLSVFVGQTTADANPATASSIVALGGGRIAVLGVGLFQGQLTQIAIYTDANGDFKADGPPTIIFNETDQFQTSLGTYGPGTSGIQVDHMDIADGLAFFSFFTPNATGSSTTDAGIAAIKDSGSGTFGAPTKIFTSPTISGRFAGITLLLGVPRVADTTAPTVKVNMPNGGETVMSGSQLAISFTSADNVGVSSHDIGLSTDGGTTFPITVATGISGSQQSFNFLIPAAIDSTTARIRVTAKDGSGNAAFDDSDANFTIMRSATADTVAPTVTITAPAAGASLNANAMATVSFTSTDNIGVASHNVLFSSNGTDFTTTLATGLSGTQTSFQFRVPAVASTTAAIRVEAVDAAGNKGQATVGSLRIVNDTTKPTVTVTAPTTKQKTKKGQPFTVTFTSRDDSGSIASHEIQLSRDSGATFSPLATGVPGNVQSFQVTFPNEKIKKAVIKVIARDAAGNAGEGVSGVFKIK